MKLSSISTIVTAPPTVIVNPNFFNPTAQAISHNPARNRKSQGMRLLHEEMQNDECRIAEDIRRFIIHHSSFFILHSAFCILHSSLLVCSREQSTRKSVRQRRCRQADF